VSTYSNVVNDNETDMISKNEINRASTISTVSTCSSTGTSSTVRNRLSTMSVESDSTDDERSVNFYLVIIYYYCDNNLKII